MCGVEYFLLAACDMCEWARGSEAKRSNAEYEYQSDTEENYYTNNETYGS